MEGLPRAEAQEADGSKDSQELQSEERKQKRRSKKDSEGRSFGCQSCDKKYLSYPALYTHIKKKHGGAEASLVAGHTGKVRGRPRKVWEDG